MTYRTPSQWRAQDLSVGMVIYEPSAPEVDFETRELTGRPSKLIVTAIKDGAATLKPYHGDREAVMPPQRDHE